MKLEPSAWSLLASTGWGLSWVAVGTVQLVEITSCAQGSTESWRASLLIGTPLAIAALILLALARPHARATRRLSLPHALLMPAALLLVVRYFALSTVHGLPLCAVATGDASFATGPQEWWTRWWAPIQAIEIAAIAAMIYRYWHRSPADHERRDASSPR